MKIIFFDGTCAMCHWAIKWVAKYDIKEDLYFAPLQGTTAKQKLQSIPDFDTPDVDSIIYLENEKPYYYSKACFRIAWELGGMWKLIGVLSFLPDLMLYPANLIYKCIAKTRSTSCDLSPISDTHFLP